MSLRGLKIKEETKPICDGDSDTWMSIACGEAHQAKDALEEASAGIIQNHFKSNMSCHHHPPYC